MKMRFLLLASVLFASSALHARYQVECSIGLRTIAESFVRSHPGLAGQDMSDGLRKHLVEKGYTFAQVSLARKAGQDVLIVQEGLMGSTTVKGNKYLSSAGIAEYLNWEHGKSFNFGSFQRSAAALNRHRFVEVDAKLAPTRGKDGEIIVDAELSAQDSLPVGGSFNVRGNVGFEEKENNDFRATVGFEYWEPFLDNDRLSGSVTFDPSSSSIAKDGDLFSLGLQYKFGPKEYSQLLYGGYFESDSVVSVDSGNLALSTLIDTLNPSGKGFHMGYQGSYDFGEDQGLVDDLGLIYGVTYLDVYSKPDSLTPKSQLTLYLPRLGFRGSLENPGPFGRGRNFWAVSATSDFSTTKNSQLRKQSEAARRGFYFVDLHLTSFQPITLDYVGGGLLVRFGGRYTSDVLPNLIKHRIGGSFNSGGVRGYTESEDSGDRGLSVSVEYRLDEYEVTIPGIDLKLQNFAFYDYGYVEELGYVLNGVTSKHTKNDLQSVGAGVIGNLNSALDFNLNVGVPIIDGADGVTEKWDPRVHFDLTWKF